MPTPPVVAPPKPEPPPAREYPEPPNLGTVTIPSAPKGKGTWVLDSEETKVSFLIVSNSAGPIRGHFIKGASGALDAKSKRGVFTIDLTTLETLDQKMQKNPVRDTNVIEAFFGARPFAAEVRPGASASDRCAAAATRRPPRR